MKKQLLFNHLCFLIFLLISYQTNAQYKQAVALGANHERLHDAFGNSARLYFIFSDNFKINTEFTRYYEVTEKQDDEAVGYDIRSIDLNMNYAIMFGEKLGIYVLMGFNYSFGRKASKNDGIVYENFIESGGLNFGFGSFYKMGRFTPYVESRSISSSYSYLVFSAGLAYSFGKEK